MPGGKDLDRGGHLRKKTSCVQRYLRWCVIFDPGTGREGEVAEVYVVPRHRGRGLATRLLHRAVDLFREREVTFAAVWTHSRNPSAVRLYQRAGFAPTEQMVLTWLPGAD